jgi:hypothetical protein
MGFAVLIVVGSAGHVEGRGTLVAQLLEAPLHGLLFLLGGEKILTRKCPYINDRCVLQKKNCEPTTETHRTVQLQYVLKREYLV